MSKKKTTTALAVKRNLPLAKLNRNSKLARKTPEALGDAQLDTLSRASVMVERARELAVALVSINARPLGDKIFVLPLPMDAKFGPILIPDIAKSEQMCGLVVAVGNGYLSEKGERVPLEVKPCNYVQYARYSGTVIDIGGMQLVQIREDDIRAVVG